MSGGSVNRRGFIRLLGGAAAAAAAPAKTYVFLGGILRPRSSVAADVFPGGPPKIGRIVSVQVLWWHEYDKLTEDQKEGRTGVIYGRLGPPSLVMPNIEIRYDR